MPKKHRKAKAKILDKATDSFLTSVRSIERKVWAFIRDLTDGLNRTNGKIDNDAFNEGQLLSLDNDLLNVFTDGLGESMPDYLANFDDVERLNKLMYGGFLSNDEANRVSRLVFNVERTILVDGATDGLTSRAAVRAALVQPIRKILYNGIVFSQPIKTLQENLRNEIQSKNGSSRLLRYTRQIAQDAISQFDGAINDRIRDDIGLDGFYYVGSIIKTTRANCGELVSGLGRFKGLAVEPGLYRVEDLPEIISLAKNRSGWNDATTPQTFAQYRGGYGCRHEVIYVPLLDEQALKASKKVL